MQLTHLHIPKLSSVTQCNTDISHAPPYKEESLYIRIFTSINLNAVYSTISPPTLKAIILRNLIMLMPLKAPLCYNVESMDSYIHRRIGAE